MIERTVRHSPSGNGERSGRPDLDQMPKAMSGKLGAATTFCFDPGANVTGCPWQCPDNSGFQLVLVGTAQAAGAAFRGETRRPPTPSS